ncbi:hypothetical protein LCGC14_1935440 [marine sediment metagenome]|uniref:Uncharacterized protein n=1 Tax=marine sediment metagenome TaxID=412755 RepID=A0A0F9FLW2_9ZZZZ
MGTLPVSPSIEESVNPGVPHKQTSPHRAPINIPDRSSHDTDSAPRVLPKRR